MAAKNLRLSVVVEEEIYRVLKELSDLKGESLSSLVKRYIEVGLLLSEDSGLASLANERLKDFAKEHTLTHEEVWG